MGSITPSAFCTQLAGPSNLTCSSTCLSLTHTQPQTHTVLHPCCNISAHTRWPTVWPPLVGQPVVQRSQHGLRTLKWITLCYSHVQAHTIYPTHAHTHITFVRMKSLCVGWRGRDKGKNLEQLKKKKRKMGSRWWKELRLSLGPALTSNTFFHLSVMVCCEGPFRQTVFLTEDFVHFDNP